MASLIRKYITTSIFCVAIAVSAIAGGAWSSGKGYGYFKIGQSYIGGNRFFSPAGHIVPITTTAIYATSLYAEYGLTNKWDVIAYFPFVVRATVNQVQDGAGNILQPGGAMTGLGDVDLTLKYGIFQDDAWKHAISLTLGIPSGTADAGIEQGLSTGDGEFNQMLTWLTSRSFGKAYGIAYAGYNKRATGFSDEFRYGIEGGYKWKDFYFILRLYGIKPIGNDNQEFTGINALFSNRVEYLSYSPEIVYEAGQHWGLTAGYGAVIYAKRIIAAPNLMVGVYFKI